MSLEEDIKAALSSLVSGRVYPAKKKPQNPIYPAITYKKISGRRIWSLGGYANLQNPRIQVDVWAKSYEEVKPLAESAITAMAGSANFKIDGVSDEDLYEPDTQLHRVSIDFSVWA